MDPDLGLSCNPAFLGPLDDDLTPVTGPVKVFEGEEKYLSARKLDARAKLCEEIAPTLATESSIQDETVLHVLPVLHYPTFPGFLRLRGVVDVFLPGRPDSHRPSRDRGADARWQNTCWNSGLLVLMGSGEQISSFLWRR